MVNDANELARYNDLIPQELRERGWLVKMIKIGSTYRGDEEFTAVLHNHGLPEDDSDRLVAGDGLTREEAIELAVRAAMEVEEERRDDDH